MNRSRQKKKKSSNQSRKILKQKKSRNIRKKSAKNKHSTNLLFKTVKLYEKQKHKYLDKHYKKIKQIGGAPPLINGFVKIKRANAFAVTTNVGTSAVGTVTVVTT